MMETSAMHQSSRSFNPCQLFLSLLVPLSAVVTGCGAPQDNATLRGHTARVASIDFSFDGSLLASGSSDNTVALWNLISKGSPAKLKGSVGTVHCARFSPD